MRSSIGSRLGGHLRTLRSGRGLTQEELAERSNLSVDAIRRLERGGFSPSLSTLGKLSGGLEISLSTLFSHLEPTRPQPVSQICDYLSHRNRNELDLAWRVVRALFEEE
jgi:transcriptional regulator with XRE-family HTH domain